MSHFKKCFQLALFSVFIFASQLSRAQFSLDHYHPKELIAELGIDTCSIFVEEADGSLTIEQSYIYDLLGNEIVNQRDFQEFSFIYHYNEDGVKVAEYFVPFGEDFYERDTLIYNDKGRLVNKITYKNDGTESKRNEYDYKGDQILEERYILKGNLQTRSIYSYNDEGRVSKIERYFRGTHSEDWIHEYDKSGDLITFKTVSAKGETTLLHKFEYNEKGLRIKHSVYSGGVDLINVILTEYDSKGLIEWEKNISSIENNDETTGEVEKTVYRYSYR